MGDKPQKETRVDVLLQFFHDNKFTAALIVTGLIVIGVAEVVESGDSVLRKIGLVKSYDVNQATNRGKFSSTLLENGWNRMFWMRAYTERIKLNASAEEQQDAYEKYIEASEKWSSNIMNYYLGLEEYYPSSNKRQILEGTIQLKFIEAAEVIRSLKFASDTLSARDKIIKIDLVQSIVSDINNDFYFLIDRPRH